MAKSDVARCRRAVEDRLGSVDKPGLGKALTRFGLCNIETSWLKINYRNNNRFVLISLEEKNPILNRLDFLFLVSRCRGITAL